MQHGPSAHGSWPGPFALSVAGECEARNATIRDVGPIRDAGQCLIQIVDLGLVPASRP